MTFDERNEEEMSNYKLIALDMDGTLLNSRKEITEGNLLALEKAAKAGKIIALCTGRSVPELMDHARRIKGLKYAVCVNGAIVYDVEAGRTVASHTMTEEQVRTLMEISKQEDTLVHFLDEGSTIQAYRPGDLKRFNMDHYGKLFEQAVTQVEDIWEHYWSNPYPVKKINIYHTDTKARERNKARFAGTGIEAVYSEITSLECSGSGVTKGRGLLDLCDILNIAADEVIMVGDSDNDLDCLKTAGLAVAMGNAKDNVKAACDVVVADCDHDGVAEAVEKYLL